MNKPVISVIIPTYQDWHRLQKCLDALSRQTFNTKAFEVIVVNNDINDSFPPNLQDITLKLKLLTETKPGSYAARNKGLQHAKGELLAFTDADCTPDPKWLYEGWVRINNSKFPRVTGPVKLYYDSIKPNIYDRYELFYGFNQVDNVKSGSSVTANLFVEKDLFKIVGLFNENMMSGGDNEWNLRASKAGFGIGYFPEIIVNHPTRNSYKKLRIKAKRIAGGKFVLIKEDKKAALKLILRGLIPRARDWQYLQTHSSKVKLAVRIQVYIIKYILNVERSLEIFRLYYANTYNK